MDMAFWEKIYKKYLLIETLQEIWHIFNCHIKLSYGTGDAHLTNGFFGFHS